jgi:tetratricopeptide (TPR) repeat protein
MTVLPAMSLLLWFSPVVRGEEKSAELTKSYDEIENCIRNKDFPEALRLSNRLSRHSVNPNDPTLLYQQARIAVGRKENKEAMAAFTKLIEVVPYRSYPYIGRGQLYLANKEYDKAIADFAESIKIAPGSPVAYFRRAEAYYNKANESVSPTIAEANLEASIRDLEMAAKSLEEYTKKLRNKELSFSLPQEKLEFDLLTRRQLELRERLDASLQRELNNLDDPEEDENGESPDGKNAAEPKGENKPADDAAPGKDDDKGVGGADDVAAPKKADAGEATGKGF